MITVNEAMKILSGIDVNSAVEEVALSDTLGRVLAEDIVSPIEMPPFDKSAMDGYAVFSGDSSVRFKVLETIAAGSSPVFSLKNHGECSAIMTGAPLPEGADKVIRVELTEKSDGYMRLTGDEQSVNVCRRGEDIKKGDIIVKKGTLIKPQHMGIIASVGRSQLKVSVRVKAAVICTGDEIVEPGKELPPGGIYNSNLYSLSGQLTGCGAEIVYTSEAVDDPEKLKETVSKSLEISDIVFITGGVSMGKYDYVPRILKESGLEIYFHKIKVKPGKPTLFAGKNGKYVFGLPGNPVSSFIIFEIIAKPFLYRLCGHDYSPIFLKAVMKKGITRKKSGREQYLPVHLNAAGEIELIEFHGSAHLAALDKSNGLLKIPAEVSEIREGSEEIVRQI